MSRDRDLTDRDLARLALEAITVRPRGRSPDLLEIDRFRGGNLQEPRRSEVLSHLALDSDAFVLLWQLEHADAELQHLKSR
jgi:hypothetical protein